MKRLSAVLAALGLAGGCATTEHRLAEVKDAWQGASYDEVVARWGQPARSADLPDGRRTHTWVSEEAPVRGGGPSVGVGVFGGSGGSGVGVGIGFPFGMSVSRASCERTMTFRDGMAVEQAWAGDPNYCSFFTRK